MPEAVTPTNGRPVAECWHAGENGVMELEQVVCGLHTVQAALDGGGEVTRVWIDRRRRDARVQAVLAAAQRAGVTVERVGRERLEELVPGQRHQGVAAQCVGAVAQDEAALRRLLAGLEVPPLLLVLDGVTDPHNVGACLRTADAVGVHAVIVPRDRAVGLNATVRKVASGAAESVPLVQVTNLARTLKWLAGEGVWLVGLAGETETSLHTADLSGPLALVMGSEGSGMRRLTREQCDQIVRIPMVGQVESLNVSVAAGVALFEAVRQRLAVDRA